MLAPLRLDGLEGHLEDRYGIEVNAVTPLDRGVFRVDRRDGSRWVARVFPDERPLAGVQGDAAILQALERAGFPSERCADPEPVSEFLGQGVLVTGFLEDHGPLRPGRPAGSPSRSRLSPDVRSRPRSADLERQFPVEPRPEPELDVGGA
jgi:hypothetical protein